MFKKYGILGFSAFVLLAIGCDDSGSSPTAVDSYPAEINEEAKTITLTLPSCEQISNTEVRYDPEGNKKTFEYELSGNSLYLDNGYAAMEYTGNNSSHYGNWTMATEECEVYGICEILKITSTSVTKSTDMSDLCAFDYMSATMFSNMVEVTQDQDILYAKTSCTSGSIEVDGKTLNVKIAKYTENETDMTITVDGVECRQYVKMIPLTASLCTIDNNLYIFEDKYMENNMEDFMQCYLPLVMDNFQDFTLEKAKIFKSMSKIFRAK